MEKYIDVIKEYDMNLYEGIKNKKIQEDNLIGLLLFLKANDELICKLLDMGISIKEDGLVETFISLHPDHKLINTLLEHDALFDKDILKYALEQISTNIFELFIKKGANTNLISETTGWTLLMRLLAPSDEPKKKYDFAKILLKNSNIDIYHRDKKNRTAISMAFFSAIANEKFPIEILELLIENGADVNEKVDGQSLLALSIGHDKSDIAQLLIEHGADVNEKVNGQSLLTLSIFLGKSDIAQLLIENGADVNEKVDGQSLLTFSIFLGKSDIAQLLIEHGADVNEKVNGQSLLTLSIFLGKSDIAQLLIENGADVNEKVDGQSLLTFSIVLGKSDIAQLLIEHGADVNEKVNGQSLLVFSIIFDDIDVFNLLYKADTDDRTALLCALIKDEEEVIELFLNKPDNINTLDKETGDNILQEIVSIDLADLKDELNIDNIKATIKNFSKVILDLAMKMETNVSTVNNTTIKDLKKFSKDLPKHIKSSFSDFKDINKLKVVQSILSYDIDINHINNDGATALDLADGIEDEEIIKELEKHGVIRNLNLNKPKKLVKILTNFTSPDFKPIRFTTHSWDFTLKKEYGNFENFMKEVKKQWDEFKDELESLSSNLHQKIESFLFETDRAKRIGWSSVKDLQEWCDAGKKPFDLIVGDKKFEEYIKEFKKEIEIRKEQHHLETLFIEQIEKLGEKFDVEFEKLQGKTFYTDVEKFTLALDKIFKVIEDNAHEEKNTIEVKAQDAENGEYIDIIILHKNSFSSTDAKTLASEVKDGDFIDIRENLTNLCDWSVQNYHDGKAYQINYLRSDNSKEIVELEKKLEGFTHILRFYK